MLQIIMQIDLNSYIAHVLLQDNYKYKLLTILYLIIFEKHKN